MGLSFLTCFMCRGSVFLCAAHFTSQILVRLKSSFIDVPWNDMRLMRESRMLSRSLMMLEQELTVLSPQPVPFSWRRELQIMHAVHRYNNSVDRVLEFCGHFCRINKTKLCVVLPLLRWRLQEHNSSMKRWPSALSTSHTQFFQR